ncbi:MAG: hypothetical protein NXY57DRAFT_1065053 [Lentinula lateritia]|nr:MAG: hypothetical protein NXY57DRAFT_1065053 [Lentinula lateritia]
MPTSPDLRNLLLSDGERCPAPTIPISMLLNPLPTNVPPLDLPATRHGTQSYSPVTQSASHSSMSVNESALRHLLYTDYKISRKTTLSVVYRYPPDSVLEYPETGTTSEEVVGHLFELRMDNWISPGRDFAYSRGEPRGNSKECVTNPLLLHSTTGEMVPCVVRHSTCQGVKICPFFDGDKETATHSSATRDQLRDLMQRSKEQQMEFSSPMRDVFERTSAYLTAIRRIGCTCEANLVGDNELEKSSLDGAERVTLRRGYPEMPNRCTGQLVFRLSFEGIPYIKCEHHSRLNNRDHFFDNTIGNGRFNVEYLEAVLTNDQEEVDRIELEAQLEGYGPRISCGTIMNNTAQRITCPWNHRSGADGALKQPGLISTGCHCTFREFEPLEEYRSFCPYILITSKGPHSHPIPLPQKTPARVKLELTSLFEKLDVDLADLTPRKFIRHPIVQYYLSSRFPMLRNPMLSDLHISLSNRSHLKVYIEQAKKVRFPRGLMWIKAQQDSLLDPKDHYVRKMVEIEASELQADQDDVSEDSPGTSAPGPFRFAICMTTEASKRFVEAQFIQSDIGFKRIVGFYEFEVASLDRYSNTTSAHHLVLAEIDKILKEDTGRALRWRHLHGHDLNDYEGLVLNWVVDQHRGQAKGIGLYLQDVAKDLAPKDDFHQPLRSIQDLSPYDHLRRVLTLCTTHFYRNVRKCPVSEEVRNLMRGLICIQHDDWEGAVGEIQVSGGLAGQNWLQDKETSKFVFPAICWEKSYIPLDIWNARPRESNIVEIIHANVNMEGTQCTLVGGVHRGKHYDLLKQRSLMNREHYGINESYGSKHPYENAMKNYKRKGKFHLTHGRRKNFHREDNKIEIHNKKIKELHAKLQNAQERVGVQSQLALLAPTSSANNDAALGALERAKSTLETTRVAFQKQVQVGQGYKGKGMSLLPVEPLVSYTFAAYFILLTKDAQQRIYL